MKGLKLFGLFAAAFLFAACGKTGTPSGQAAASNEGISEHVSSESVPEVSSPASSEESSSEETIVYTVKGVMEDICTSFFGSAVEEEDYFSDGEGGYYTGVNFGSYGEEYLELAVSTSISHLPEYLVELSAPEAGEWEDGEAGYFASYATEDQSVSVAIGSYVYNGSLCAQINVF